MKRPTVGFPFAPRRLAAAFLTSVALLGAAAPVLAQDAPVPLPTVLENARHDQTYLRVATAADTIEGRVLDLSDNVVELAGGSVRLAEVTRVEKGEKHGRGALIGATIGGTALSALFALAAMALGASDDTAEVIGVGAFIGGVGGGLIGAAVAPSHYEWRAVWTP